MASITDKITDVRNAARPNSARVTSGRSAGGATLACDNLSGWPTASKVHFVTYKIDSNSDVVAGTQLDCYGIVSGNNIGSFTVVDGSDTGHAVGDVVEMLPTAAWGQDLADALSVGHTRTGAHASALPLTSPVLTTPVIADFTSAGHTHASTAQGGQLTGSSAISAGTVNFANLLSTIFSGQVQTQANAGTAGGTLWWVNLGGIKILWAAGASQSVGTGGATITYTLPVFFTTISVALPVQGVLGTSASQNAYLTTAATTSSVSVGIVSASNGSTQSTNLLIIGT